MIKSTANRKRGGESPLGKCPKEGAREKHGRGTRESTANNARSLGGDQEDVSVPGLCHRHCGSWDRSGKGRCREEAREAGKITHTERGNLVQTEDKIQASSRRDQVRADAS